MKEKVNENNRKAAKSMWMKYYAKSTDCTLRLGGWQNECQQSINNFRSWKSGD